MFNTVESINDPYEWGKLATQVQNKTSDGAKDSSPAEVRFLNNQTESQVKGTLRKESDTKSYTIYLEHVDYHIDKLNKMNQKVSNNGYTQQDFYNSHFIFDNVTNFNISGLRWNIPDCKYYDILIPSFPPEVFHTNMRNEPILTRQMGKTYNRQAHIGKHEYPSIIHGTDSFQGFKLQKDEILRVTITSLDDSSSSEEDINIKKGINYESIDTFIKEITSQNKTILSSSKKLELDIETYTQDNNIVMIRSGKYKGDDAPHLSLSDTGTSVIDGTTIDVNKIDTIKKIFGSNATIDSVNNTFQEGYTETGDISLNQSLSIGARFNTPISLDFNNIPIYARFSDISEPHLKVLDERLVQVYPQNELSFDNLQKKYGIPRLHPMQIEKHIHFQFSVTTKDKPRYD